MVNGAYDFRKPNHFSEMGMLGYKMWINKYKGLDDILCLGQVC